MQAGGAAAIVSVVVTTGDVSCQKWWLMICYRKVVQKFKQQRQRAVTHQKVRSRAGCFDSVHMYFDEVPPLHGEDEDFERTRQSVTFLCMQFISKHYILAYYPSNLRTSVRRVSRWEPAKKI